MTTTYGYYSPEPTLTSDLLISYSNRISASDYVGKNIDFTYNYDNNGNITEVRQNGTLTNKYYYDEAGQVIREDWAQQEKTITYSYDNGGNITSKNEYAYSESEVLGEAIASNTFSYSNNAWKDQLTSVNNEDITYDALGNPVSYGDDITYTWNGRQLLEYKNSNPNEYIRCVYTYDADGLRTRKLVYQHKNSTDTTEYLVKQYDYVWKDGVLDSEKYTMYNDDGGVYKTVVYKYLYDEYNSPIGMALWTDGEEIGNYWFVKNAQGDVTAVYCEGAGVVVNYHYDAYGNVKATAGEKGTLGAIVMLLYNSIMYRGYYFDIDTNLYYLKSRYYSPIWGRFINADDVEYLGASGKTLGYNLYAYCENNPVNYVDIEGEAAAAIAATGYGAYLAAAGSSAATLNPLGLAISGGILLVGGAILAYKAYQDKALSNAINMLNHASTAATPPPPDKGGKGTKVTSKNLYTKNGKNGYHIDVENPGGRQGQIHLQMNNDPKTKYFYNVKDQTFRVNSSTGKMAPKSIQKYLTEPKVIKAISKGLTILGY